MIWTGHLRSPARTNCDVDHIMVHDNPFDENGVRSAFEMDYDNDEGAGGGKKKGKKDDDDDDDTEIDTSSRAGRHLKKHGGDAEAAIEALLRESIQHRRIAQGKETPPEKVDKELYAENVRLVKEVADLSGEMDRVRSRYKELRDKLPKHGIIPDDDEAKVLKAIRDAKLPIADALSLIKDGPALKAKVAEGERATVQSEAARVTGLNEKALIRVANAEKVHIEVRDVEVEKGGKKEKEKRAFARPMADEKAALLPLDEYVNTHLKDYLPALTAKDGSGATGGTPRTDAPRTTFPAQSGVAGTTTSGDATGDFVKSAQAARDNRPSPFKKPTQPATQGAQR